MMSRNSSTSQAALQGATAVIARIASLACVLAPGALLAAKYDVVIYGGTAGGAVAAIAAAREGASVALLEPGRHLGGMTSGGLGRTDHGKKETIGGYSLEFYQRVGKHYGKEIEWYFEPHVAEDVLKAWTAEAGVRVFYEHRLREDGGVSKKKRRIRAIYVENGTEWEASVFMDATYEGDLLKQAGASYAVGRESAAQYNESLAGVRPKDRNHQFDFPVKALGDNKQLLADIQAGERGGIGAGDKKVQAYNFRLCLSDDPANRFPFPKPAGYVPLRYEILRRYIEAFNEHKGAYPTMNQLFIMSRLAVPSKTDINNRGPVSTDFIGGSWEYPEAGYALRARIWQAHMDYTAGMFYYLANDPKVPQALREEAGKWGLCADEFIDTNHWPHQLYVREARRLAGDFVMTQRDIQTELVKPDVIGMGSYNSDSHNVQRYAQLDGTVQNEGNMEVAVTPYQIPYRVLLPKKKQVENLLVPVCVSSSHVTYSTLRMEPVYMILGQAAGVAAKMAISAGVAVHDIDTAALTKTLKEQNAVLEWRKP